VTIRALRNGQQVSIVSNRWTFHPDRRGVVVVFMDQATGRIRLYSMPDVVPED
jgi:hypothetical protein